MKQSVFVPVFLDLFRNKQYNKQKFFKDVLAGLIVGVIALPLNIAFAAACGFSPQYGMITGIIAGFLVSFFGGSNVMIAGPTGAFVVVVTDVVKDYGVDGLMIATAMAGIMLIAMGALQLGSIIRFIPYPIVVGFNSGLAFIIFTSQIYNFFGIPEPSVPLDSIHKWQDVLLHIANINWAETILATVAIIFIALWPKITKKVPALLVLLVSGTIVSELLRHFAGIDFATIGGKFPELAGGVDIPTPHMPAVTLDRITELFPSAFSIAMLGAIASLLAAMVADGITGQKHRSNTELIGQGLANLVAPFFGGIPAAGAAARTMANVGYGGRSPIAGITQAALLVVIYVCLLPFTVYIPFAVLAAIIIMAAYNMSEWRTFRDLLKSDRSDVAVLLITFFLTVLMGLTIAIEVGLLLAILLFVNRVGKTAKVELHADSQILATENDEANAAEVEHLDVPESVEIYQIDGPFFFGLASKLEELDPAIHRRGVVVRIIRMRKVPFIDSTGIHNLRSLCRRSHQAGIRIILSGVTPEVHNTLRTSGFAAELGEEYIFPHIIPALQKAKDIL